MGLAADHAGYAPPGQGFNSRTRGVASPREAVSSEPMRPAGDQRCKDASKKICGEVQAKIEAHIGPLPPG
jgi:hypothetical protein